MFRLSNYQRYRLYEFLPALSILSTLLFAVFLSFIRPLWMIYLIIIFDVYWVLRVVYFSSYLILAWRRFHVAARTDWFRRLTDAFPNWSKKKNVVLIPLYNEGWEVVLETLSGLLASSFPSDKLYVVLSGEARNLKHWQEMQIKIKKQFTGRFADILFFTHQAGLPDEIPGKGSNIHYAEWEFKKYVDEKGWDYGDVIISVFDVDTVAHREYFSHLTYLYLSHPNPTHSSFQPVTLYNNNIWELPSILRVMAFGTSFWMLFSLARLDNLVTFSSHSMSFKAIVETGGHAKNVVSEDSRIFFDCFLHYNCDYEVTPLYVPVSMDTVRDDNWLKSLKNLYFQQRRWAWGSENIPYLLWKLRGNKKISRWKKFNVLFHEWEGKWSWGVVAILITLLGRLPLWTADEAVRQSALFFNTPHVLEALMTAAMLGLFVSAAVSFLILPRRPSGHSPKKYLFMILQWLLVPVYLICFSSIPCIDAVTHLMFGRYLGFNVSAKKRA